MNAEPNSRIDGDVVEALLTREGRTGLSLARLIVLYFDPSAYFKDASRGPLWRREQARAFNRQQRPLLLMYLGRWLVVAAGSFLGIATAESLAAHIPLFVVPAAGFGIGCGIALTVAAWTATAYVLLGLRPEDRYPR